MVFDDDLLTMCSTILWKNMFEATDVVVILQVQLVQEHSTVFLAALVGMNEIEHDFRPFERSYIISSRTARV